MRVIVFIKISYILKNPADNYFSQCLSRKRMFTCGKSNFTRQFVHFIARSHDASRSLSLDVKDDSISQIFVSSEKYFYAMRKMSFKVIFFLIVRVCCCLQRVTCENSFYIPTLNKNNIKFKYITWASTCPTTHSRKRDFSHTLNLWNEKYLQRGS